MIIEKESDDGCISVTVDTEKKTIYLSCVYTNLTLDVPGSIEKSERYNEVVVKWGFPVDYITFQILTNIIFNKIQLKDPTLSSVPMTEIFNELARMEYVEEEEIIHELDFIFYTKYMDRGEPLADFFLQLLEYFTEIVVSLYGED
jgi:hypothetical protein